MLVLHLTALLEVGLAGALALLSTHPFGSFEVRSCHVKSLSDWYTLLHNPSPNYERKVHCTQEAVYPLCVFLQENYVVKVYICVADIQLYSYSTGTVWC